jgi:DNA-binding NarL/FixJ family response regulator
MTKYGSMTSGDVVIEKKNSGNPGVVKTKIMIVDDHPVVRDGLALLINCETDMAVIASAGTAAQAVKAIGKHSIDLAIVDMLLKGTTGDQITQKIEAICPNLIVLMFSMSDDLHHIQQAFKAGARGYITKDELSEKIIYAIRRVLKGETYLSKRLSKMFTRRQLSKLLAQDDKRTQIMAKNPIEGGTRSTKRVSRILR